VKKLLVIQTAFAGDAILTLPMIQKLKEKFNSYQIDVLCIPSTEEIFRASAYVNDVKIIDKKGSHKSLFSLVSFARKLKKQDYEIIYSVHRSFRTGILIKILNAKSSYGFSTSSLKFFYKNLIKYSSSKHEVQRNLDLIEYKYDDDSWRILPDITINEKQKEKVNEFIENNRINNFIIVAPGSVWNTKKYPKEYYIEIIKSLIDKHCIVLIGGKQDIDLCNEIKSNFEKKVFSTSGLFSLIESIELLKHSKLLITNDSAPTHLGMCANIPVLTIYCSTIAGFGFYPYNKKSFYLSFDNLNCKPCGIHGYMKCPLGHFNCGYKLMPNLVIDKVMEMIND
jgi:lipopolysaccharide heptosyltransferase II